MGKDSQRGNPTWSYMFCLIKQPGPSEHHGMAAQGTPPLVVQERNSKLVFAQTSSVKTCNKNMLDHDRVGASLFSSPRRVFLLSLQFLLHLLKRSRVGLWTLLAAKHPEMVERPLQSAGVFVERGRFLQGGSAGLTDLLCYAHAPDRNLNASSKSDWTTSTQLHAKRDLPTSRQTLQRLARTRNLKPKCAP